MAKLISRTEKRGRGRPATNPKSIHLTLEPGPLSEVDQWIARQKEPGLTRPEGIRRLVELGLKVKTKSPPKREDHSKIEDQKQRAREMAGRAIDKMADASASLDDRASRKRRLIKGPEEFRNVRRDLNGEP
jgi:hypothetical protein